MKPKCLLFFLFALGIVACAPARYVKTLDKGTHALSGSFGGPITKVPGVGAIPIPFTSLGYAYGLSNDITIFGNIHTTSLLFGVGQLDCGVSYKAWSNQKMGLSFQASVNGMLDFYTGANHFFPQIDANYYYDYRKIRCKPKGGEGFEKTQSMYFGISNWFDLYKYESQGRLNEQFWIPNLQVGHLWEKNQWVFQGEFKLLAPLHSNENIVVDYPSITGDKGAFALYFGLIYKLKK